MGRKMTQTQRRATGLVGGAIALTLGIGAAHGGHLSLATDVDMLRPGLGPDAGYLNFLGGAEYTGHTDQFETEDGGHDWADNWITVKHIVLDNLFGTPPSNADVARDMNFSRKVFAQAGIAVRREQTASRMADDAGPIDGDNINRIVEDEIDVRSPNAETINIYYWEDIQTRSGDPVLGLTSFAKFDGPSWIFLDSDADNATHAHELGHMLHNGPAIHQQQPDDENHSNDPTNYIADGRIQDRPVVLTDVGPDNGDTGGTMIIEPSQIQTIHGNPGAENPGFVKHANHVQTHGDRADFDWVSDQRILETVPDPTHGADLQPGEDYLVWSINPAQVGTSDHEGPAEDEHQHVGGELALPGFAGDAIRAIDVFSNINLYADNELTPRDRALDYLIPEFSADGGTWHPGQLVNVFQRGWRAGLMQENYIARFTTDLAGAQFVRLRSRALGGGHDGNTQIDAVVASSVAATSFVPMTGTPVSRLPGAATYQITPDGGFTGPSGDDVAGLFPIGGTDTGNGNAPFDIITDTAPENGTMRFTVDFVPEAGEAPPDEFRLDLVQFVGLASSVFDPAGTLRAVDGGATVRDHLAADGSRYTMQFELDSPGGIRKAFEFLFLPADGLNITAADSIANPDGLSDIFLQMDLLRTGDPLNAAVAALADVQSTTDPNRLLTVELRAGQLTGVLIPEPASSGILAIAVLCGVGARRRRR